MTVVNLRDILAHCQRVQFLDVLEIDAAFILQVSLEMGFGGGSECVAFELHRIWQALSIDARAVTSHATEPEARQGISFVAPWLMHFGLRSRWPYLATIFTVPLFTLAATFGSG